MKYEGLRRKVGAQGLHWDITAGRSGKPEGTVGISDLLVEGEGERRERDTEKRAGSGGRTPMKNMAFLGCPGLTLPRVSEVSRYWFLKTNFCIREKKIR